MKLAPRRVLLFLAMVAAGLAVVKLLADPTRGERGRDPVGEVDRTSADGRIRIVDPTSRSETQVVFGELDFDVKQSVEVEPGKFDDRVTARVHILSARPDPTGAFLAEGPTVHMLDWRTGEQNGLLSSDHARFETGGSAGGSITVDVLDLHAERYDLTGHVRGAFPLADGLEARLSCDELQVRGDHVIAPGFVSIERDDLTLTGTDFDWDRATGRLLIDATAHLRLQPTADRPGLDVDAPGGLTGTLPPGAADPRSAFYGELRGRVAGQTTDGSRFESDDLVVDAREGRLVLQSQAFLAQQRDGVERELTAERVSVQTDGEGRFALAEATGAVRLLTGPVAVVPARLLTDRLVVTPHGAEAPGHASWSQDAVVVAGTHVTWDDEAGVLEAERDGQVDVRPGDHPLAGLHLVAPGGMRFTLPPEATDPVAAGRGRLRGRVQGELADGTDFSADVLLIDGPERRFTLEGAPVVQQSAGGRSSRLDGQRMTLETDADGQIAFLSAEGEVVLVSGPVEVLPARLLADSLQRRDGLVTSQGQVTWEQFSGEARGIKVVGTGMAWDEAAGRLTLDRDATLSFLDPERRLDSQLVAAGGLAWTVPADASRPAQEGTGELLGPVTGTLDDGSDLAADRVLVDGTARRVTLLGHAHVGLPREGGRLTLSSEELVAESQADDRGRKLSSPRAVSFSGPDFDGSGTGLAWDGDSGRLVLEHDVTLELHGSVTGSLAGSGPLVVDVPPGGKDPFANGVGSLAGGVSGTLRSAGGAAAATSDRIEGDSLHWNGPERRLELTGRARWERHDGARGFTVSSPGTLVSFGTPGDEVGRFEVPLDASIELRPGDGGEPVRLSGRSLVADRATRRVELVGDAIAERSQGSGETAVDWRVSADALSLEAGDDDEPRRVRAEGRARLSRRSGDELLALADTLDWDLPGDLAVLEGNGRLLASGFWMEFARAEVSPRAETFRIVRSVIHVGD